MKLTLKNIISGFLSATSLNANNNAIVNAVEDCLSKSGAGSNAMTSDLDMNGHKILNYTPPATPVDPAALASAVSSGITSQVPPLVSSGIASATPGIVSSAQSGVVKRINGTTPDASGALTIATGSSDASTLTSGLLPDARLSATAAKTSLGYTPLNPANNLNELTPASARANLGALGLTYTVAGSTSAAILTKLQSGVPLCPEEFGAVGGGVDDTTAITSWLAALASTGRPGFLNKIYDLTSALSVTTAVSIHGSGTQLSGLRFTGCNGLTIDMSAATTGVPSRLSDFCIINKDSNANTGLTVKGNTGTYGSALIPPLIMNGMRVSGNNSSKGWSTAMKATDCGLMIVYDCVFMGVSNNTSWGTYGVYCDGNSTNVWFERCSFCWLNNALFGPVQTGSGVSEGWQIRGCQFLATNYSIQIGSSGNGHFIDGNDFDSSTRSIVLGSSANGGGGLSSITRNLFLQGQNATPTDFAVIDSFANYLVVQGNTCNGAHQSYTTYFLKVGTGSSSATCKVVATGNIIRGVDFGFYLGTGTYQSLITSNSYDYGGNTSGSLISNASGATGVNVNKVFFNVESVSSGVNFNNAAGFVFPSFRNGVSANTSNTFGNNSDVTIPFNTADISQGGGGGSSTYNAPIAGTYLMKIKLRLTGVTSSHNAAVLYLHTPSTTYEYAFNPAALVNSGGLLTINNEEVVALARGDSVSWSLNIQQGTQVVGIQAGYAYTYWTGTLIRPA